MSVHEKKFLQWLQQLGYATKVKNLCDSAVVEFAKNNRGELEDRSSKDDILHFVYYLYRKRGLGSEITWYQHSSLWKKDRQRQAVRTHLALKSPEEFQCDFTSVWDTAKYPDVNVAMIDASLQKLIKNVTDDIAAKERTERALANRPSKFTYNPKDPFDFNTQKAKHNDFVNACRWSQDDARKLMGVKRRVLPDAETFKKFGPGTYVEGENGKPEKIDEDEYHDFGYVDENNDVNVDAEPAMVYVPKSLNFIANNSKPSSTVIAKLPARSQSSQAGLTFI